jgi:MerR family transcriptional regulator, thiopeptide resistance regulator
VALSTRQLADLAGTTVKTVRHYHEIGLLEVPERTSNGYKQYAVTDLVRLLQIKRLTDLGIPLAQIPALSGVDHDLEQAIRDVDTEIETRIKRLREIRSELRGILRDRAPVDVPAGFGAVARDLSESDRALIMVYSRVLAEDELTDLHDMLLDRDPLDDEFDALPPDADEATIQNLAERYAPIIRRQIIDYPWIMQPISAFLRGGTGVAQEMVAEAILALYNPAQQSVRAHIGLTVGQETVAADEGSAQ